jgi:hypothetical protein
VHADANAAKAARGVNALAYTAGRDVVFGAGQYAPASNAGKLLLAHELAHVIQQQAIVQPVRIETVGSSEHPLEREADAANSAIMRGPRLLTPGSMRTKAVTQDALQRQTNEAQDAAASSDAPAPCAVHAGCPPDFCKPFSSPILAKLDRGLKAEIILLGIGVKVDSRVTPLWRTHIYGGSSLLNLSSQFANDFTNSQTTADATYFLTEALKTDLQNYPPSFPPGKNEMSVNLWFLIGPEITELGLTAPHQNRMDFSHPFEVPGNIAGDIGDDQLSCSVGAQPSPQNDVRTAHGTADITRKPDGTWFVVPHITFTVKDTIDLCPGNCGLGSEQVATVPISRWEATGISGDVPFEVNFPSPQCSFSILAPLGSEPPVPKSASPKTTIPQTTAPKLLLPKLLLPC